MTVRFLPGALAGAVLGAYALTKIHLEWLELLIAVFLLVAVFSFGFGKKERTFTAKAWQFLPAGFLFAFVSGLIGSSGPAVNPLYLNYGLLKEEMIATKATSAVVAHIVKMVACAALGALTPQSLGYGLAIGLAAAPANWGAQHLLGKISDVQFRQLVPGMMAIAAVFMLWAQRDLVMFW